MESIAIVEMACLYRDARPPRELWERQAFRAAVVAGPAAELASRLQKRLKVLGSATRTLDPAKGLFLAHAPGPCRVALLFSGQAAPVYTGGGVWARRFPEVESLPAFDPPILVGLPRRYTSGSHCHRIPPACPGRNRKPGEGCSTTRFVSLRMAEDAA